MEDEAEEPGGGIPWNTDEARAWRSEATIERCGTGTTQKERRNGDTSAE
jgi:hypothetical protein